MLSTLGELRAGADWPALGERVLGRRRRRARRWASRTRVLGVTRIHRAERRPYAAPTCSPPPSPRIALLPGLLTADRRRGQAADAAPDPAARQLLQRLRPALSRPAAGRRRSTRLGVAAAPDCGGANACFAAELQRREGRHALRPRQGHAGQGPPRPLPAAELRRVVLTAVDLLEGARRDLHDPGEGGRQADRPRAAGEDGQRGDQAGTALSAASRSAAASTAPSRPGKRASTSSRRSDTCRCVPSARVWVMPGLAQHPEVMRAGGLGDAEVERAARALALGGQLAHDRHAHRIAQRGHHGRERHARRYEVRRSACSTIIVLRANRRQINVRQIDRTSDAPPLPHRRARLGRDVPDRRLRDHHVDPST